MTAATDLLTDAFGRIRDLGRSAVDGLDESQLAARVDGTANSVAWLVWHAARVQDDHVAGVAGTEQVYAEQGWADRFGLPLDDTDTGYGHSGEQVGSVRASAALLTGYLDAVVERSVGYVGGLSDDDLARVVDERWDPPVTLAVRLMSVVGDDLQHLGQAAFAKGLLA